MKYLFAFLLTMFAALSSVSVTNGAEEKTSVTSLLEDDYEIVGIIPTTSGTPGIFLKKDDMLIACFVAETPTSKEIATQYCKPVK